MPSPPPASCRRPSSRATLPPSSTTAWRARSISTSAPPRVASRAVHRHICQVLNEAAALLAGLEHRHPHDFYHHAAGDFFVFIVCLVLVVFAPLPGGRGAGGTG